MHILKITFLGCLLISAFPASLARCENRGQVAPEHLTRGTIIGAWHLVGIDYSGPNGSLVDPIFGPNPQGMIVYDSSGWMSVQIVSADRPTMARPDSRTSGVLTADDAMQAAQAFNSYYAYFGTWEFDAAESVITHHLKASLLPYETGVDYQREVSFDGMHLKLIVRSRQNGETRQRTLVWVRVAGSQVASQTGGSAAAIMQKESLTTTPLTDTKYGDMPTDYEVAVRKYFQEHLKHPDSVQYQSITMPIQGYTTAVTGVILMREKREYGWTVKATVNAKNSQDMYVGLKTYTFLFRGPKIIDVRLPLPGDEMN